MSAGPLAWVLNLDAEHKLEARGAYTPSRELERIVARSRKGLLGGLVAAEDVVVEEGSVDARGLPGIAWCPTPRALALLARCGAAAPAAPSIEVLREVNARPFAARFDERKSVVRDLDEALARLAAPAPHGRLVRRVFGAAGRGRRRVAAGALGTGDRAWVEAGLRRGPLVIEPWVPVLLEVARHGIVDPDGGVEIGPPCVQETTPQGAWSSSRRARAGELTRAEDGALETAADAAGRALAGAGYFGPFGVDAFRYEAARGAAFQPVGEINARFTMGWHVGMGSAARLAGRLGGRSA